MPCCGAQTRRSRHPPVRLPIRSGAEGKGVVAPRSAITKKKHHTRQTPLEPPPSSTGKPGAVGEHCLSATARVAQPPGLTSSAGNPEGAVDGGRLLWITFLGEARKVISRRAAPGNQTFREAPKYCHSSQCPLIIAPYTSWLLHPARIISVASQLVLIIRETKTAWCFPVVAAINRVSDDYGCGLRWTAKKLIPYEFKFRSVFY